ncbi:hypothetical protein [Roseimicrobium sp. ORNL1]|uniref:hypothetical protein n=1 Tax=Roseimicrobium sp. ORNL1 TaxID=2711231 RepID=UPI0013E139C9|nr:hypothetical protein [Roseimicrobium sp. ORNL1]QIF05064.1 hypothetical protein G5S37_27305 [Roseimicrobium sp. ORNL1]
MTLKRELVASCMKWQKRLLIAVGLLVTALSLMVLTFHMRGLRMWEDFCAKARAAGEPITLEDVIPEAVPDDENVARAQIFWELFESKSSARLAKITLKSSYRRDSDGELIGVPRGWVVRGDNTYAREWLEFVKGSEAESSKSEAPALEHSLPSNAGQELQLRLAQYNPIWNDLGTAVRRPRCRWPLDYEEGARMKSPHHTEILGLHPLLKARLIAHATCDDTDQYIHDLTTGFLLSRHLSDTQLSLLSFLVANAMRTVVLDTMQRTADAVTWNEKDLAMIQELASTQAISDLVQSLKKEQALGADMLLKIHVDELAPLLDGDFGSMLSGESDQLKELQATLILSRPSGWKLGELAQHYGESRKLWMQYTSRDLQYILPGGLEALRNRGQHFDEHAHWLSFDSVLAVAEGVTPKMFERAMRVQALSNAAVIWCAVGRYRLKHGQLPESLERLVPEFVKEIPVDPMFGGPMRYLKKESGGFLIYSIGPNGIDDGGQGSGGTRDLDWVWASGPGLTPAENNDVKENDEK